MTVISVYPGKRQGIILLLPVVSPPDIIHTCTFRGRVFPRPILTLILENPVTIDNNEPNNHQEHLSQTPRHETGEASNAAAGTDDTAPQKDAATSTADGTVNHSEMLRNKLWAVANDLRGKMNPDEYKDYMLGFLFYKYLSENTEKHLDRMLADEHVTYRMLADPANTPAGETPENYLALLKEEALADPDLGYFLPPQYLFSAVAAKAQTPGTMILDDLYAAFNAIETSGRETESTSFNNLFEDIDLTSTKLGHTPTERNTLIAKVITHFATLGFSFADADNDLLGDSYEYLIANFASTSGKKGGEFYTPQEVSTILTRIVSTGKERLRRVYDPTCGSGSLLLRLARETDVSEYYGQEMNRTTYNLARMNMILHGVAADRFHFANNDTLEHPAHVDGYAGRMDAIVANPPFSAHWSANELYRTDERFAPYGSLAPKTKADYAFIQHILHMLKNDGALAAVVVPHGVLFRGASEEKIRKYVVERLNAVDAVIGLPANIFYGTSIPTAILVLRKDREPDDTVLFVDASGGFEKGKNQNRLRPEDIDRIVDTWRNRCEVERYSRLVTLKEVAGNDYNLNITRYVSTVEEEPLVDLDAVGEQLRVLRREEAKLDAELVAMLGELGVGFPTGVPVLPLGSSLIVESAVVDEYDTEAGHA